MLCCCWRVRVHSLVPAGLLLARPGPLSCSCCAAAGTSRPTFLWLPCCCWHVRLRSLMAAVMLLARPGPRSYADCAAADTSGSTLLWLLRGCWRVRVRFGMVIMPPICPGPGPGLGPCRSDEIVKKWCCARVRVLVLSSGSHWRRIRVPAVLHLPHWQRVRVRVGGHTPLGF